MLFRSAAVEKALGEELERDRTKTYVVEISPLGLVEMTRQNVTDGPREVMTKKCPTCGGDGIVVSEHTAAVDVERRLRGLVTPGSRDKAFKVEVAAKVASLLVGPAGVRLRELEETTKRRFFLVGKEGEHLDHFRVLAQGTLEKVAPSLPVEIGQELELKLGEVGLHDPHAGVAKLDGVNVSVANAAKLVGKKVKARIAAVGEGAAWAELVDPVEVADEPLTAEAEAEKPTRARRATTRKKDEDVPEAGSGEPAEEQVPEGEEETEAPDAGAEAEAAGAPPKKKTRRGSRGGRARKKKTATAAGGASASAEEEPESAEEEPPAAEEPEAARAPAGPVIHVPDRDLGAEQEPEEPEGDGGAAPPKKKTRRGSRGGRNRRKKTATAAGATTAVAEAEADAPAEAEPPADENGGGDAWGYTPMSEWGLDDREG